MNINSYLEEYFEWYNILEKLDDDDDDDYFGHYLAAILCTWPGAKGNGVSRNVRSSLDGETEFLCVWLNSTWLISPLEHQSYYIIIIIFFHICLPHQNN